MHNISIFHRRPLANNLVCHFSAIAVAMSGGIDSSVSAMLLKEQVKHKLYFSFISKALFLCNERGMMSLEYLCGTGIVAMKLVALCAILIKSI